MAAEAATPGARHQSQAAPAATGGRLRRARLRSDGPGPDRGHGTSILAAVGALPRRPDAGALGPAAAAARQLHQADARASPSAAGGDLVVLHPEGGNQDAAPPDRRAV